MIKERKSSYKKMWSLSYPLMLANLSFVLLNFIDIKMVGALGKEAVAAVGISLSLIWLLQVPILESFMDNAVIIFTRYFAAGDWNRLAQVFFQECKIAFALGIATWIFLIPFYYICSVMAENITIANMSFSYCLIVIVGFPICGLGAIGMRLLLALNRNKLISVFSVLGVIINILLDYLLIFGKYGFPEMGVAGAALGTMIAKLFENIAFFLAALRFIVGKRTLKIRAEKKVYKEILHSGVSVYLCSV